MLRRPGRVGAYAFIAGLLMAIISAVPAGAVTLMVGDHQQYKQPSEAARAVQAGDTVEIAPGTYYDCAVWTKDHLTIEGTAPGSC